MSACLPGCRRPTTAQAHCAECHRTFGGVTGFDQHRKGGTCVDLAKFGYELMGGIWRRPMSPEQIARRSGATT